MKNNAVIRLSTQTPARKTKAVIKTSVSQTLTGIDSDVNHLWQMYQLQLQRNGELLSIIDRQQQFISQVISQGALNLITPPPVPEIVPPPPPAIPLPEFKELSVDALNEHVVRFRDFFPRDVKRLDGMHGIIKLLYTLKQTGGIDFPEQLFEKCKMGKSTGFRHAAFLQRRHLIKTVGGKYYTRYKISHWGSQFLDGTLQKGYDKLIEHYPNQEEGKKAWEPYMNLSA